MPWWANGLVVQAGAEPRVVAIAKCFEGGGAITPVPQSRVLYPPARAHFSFPCPHNDCDGSFNLDTVVQAAVDDPSHRIEGVLKCAGLRGGDFTAKLPCRLHLRYTLTAVCSPAH